MRNYNEFIFLLFIIFNLKFFYIYIDLAKTIVSDFSDNQNNRN
jgi:hypothetical protein